MKGRITDSQVKVYSEPDLNSLSIATLTTGDEVEFMSIRKKNRKAWAEVSFSGSQKGYLPAETKAVFYKQASLLQNNVNMYSQPSTQSQRKASLSKGTRFYILDIIDRDRKEPWIKMRDDSGAEGYINGNARIKIITEITRALGRRSMISGGLWCLTGIIIASGVFPNAIPTGVFIITWGAIIYGTYQFARGLYQFWNAPY